MSTEKQKGLSIKRDGNSNRFVASWKLGEKKGYSDQDLVWWGVYLKTTDNPAKKKRYESKHTVIDLGKKTTSQAFYVDFSKYPPDGIKRLCSIKVKIRGKRNKKWSAWTYATFDVQNPRKLTKISQPAPISNAPNAAIYSWQINDNGGKKIFYRCHYQVVERPGTKIKSLADVKKSPWSKAIKDVKNYKGNSVSVPITALPTGTNNIAQCFRVRAYGPQGFSDWIYSWHIFGMAPEVANVSATSIDTPNGYIISVTWSSPSTKYLHPVDGTVVDYTYVEPVITKNVEDNVTSFEITCPNNPSWNSRAATVDTKGIDRLTFAADGKPEENQCIFIRVNNLHDLDETTRYGERILLKNGDTCGYLSTPLFKSVDYNESTSRVSIEAENRTGLVNSYTAVYFTKNDEEPQVIGIIPYGSAPINTFTVPTLDPSDTYKFGLKTYVADYTENEDNEDGSKSYTIDTVYMESEMEWKGGTIPNAPKITLSNPEPGCILVEWDWPWREAQSAELSWSDNKNAWESTEEPSTFIVKNTHAAKWRIYGLDYSKWYVRVRLIQTGENYENFGLYSDTGPIDLVAEIPPTPMLTVEPEIVAEEGEISFYWAYEAEDGSTQLQADIVEVTEEDGNLIYGDPIRSSGTAQHLTVGVGETLGWHSGETHQVALRTISSFGMVSNYSDIVTIRVADPLVASATLGTGFSSYVEEDQTFYELNSFPFSVTVTGAGDDGTTGFLIQRAYPYPLERPDEKDIMGYEGETVALVQDMPNGTITVEANDPVIIGSLDDTEEYILTVTATDSYGQQDTDSIRFRVNWDHKASLPSAGIMMDYNNMAAILTPLAHPGVDFYIQDDEVVAEAESVESDVIGDMSFSFDEGGDLIYSYDDAAFTDFHLDDGDLYAETDGEISTVVEGDVCDIYRLSSDKPELVYAGARFGKVYVDPYPTIGRFGGYRFVYRTKYNDFITSTGMLGWTDYGYEDGAALDLFTSIIDFDDEQILIPFNLDLSHKWEKDFIETKYLGGSIQGDWNPAVSHTLSMHTDIAVEYQSETFLAMRRLARYPGVCHIRTPDGSSFAANISVSEDREEKMINMIAKFSLEITRVDQENEDGMTWAEWSGEDEEEESG